MVEFWFVIGRVCLDDGFHRELFLPADARAAFEELTEFRRLLRVEHRLRLSRWEIMTTNLAVSREILSDGSWRVFSSVEDDTTVLAIRAGWNSLGVSLPTNPEFHAAVGLACVDLMFRQALFNAIDPAAPSDISRLHSLVTSPEEELPAFMLSLDEVLILSRFIRADGVMEAMEIFHAGRWVQPTKEPCDGGYTKLADASYKYFSQPELILLIRANPDLAEEMKKIKALNTM